jgi:hypothetical protein
MYGPEPRLYQPIHMPISWELWVPLVREWVTWTLLLHGTADGYGSRCPASVKLTLEGHMPQGVTAKDVILNLLRIYGANTLLGYSIELYGEAVDRMSLDERITIASMATEMGAIIILFPPTPE